MGRTAQGTEGTGVESVLSQEDQPLSNVDRALACLRALESQWRAERELMYKKGAMSVVVSYDWILDNLQNMLESSKALLRMHGKHEYELRATAALRNKLAFLALHAKEVNTHKMQNRDYSQIQDKLIAQLLFELDDFK